MFAFNRQICYSGLLSLSFAVYGISFSIAGTALIDLQHIIKVSLTTASLLVTYQYAGHVTGSVVMGLLYSRMNVYLCHVYILVSLSATLFIIPWCTDVMMMSTGHLFIGLFGGSIDSLCVCEVMRVWGSTTSVPINIMWFGYSAGILIVNFLFAPFLTFEASPTNNTDDMWMNITNVPATVDKTGLNSDTRDLHLLAPYTIISTISLSLAISFFVFYLDMYFRNGKLETPNEDVLKSTEQHYGLRIILFIFSSMIYILSCSLSLSFYTFITVYYLTWMKWTKENAQMCALVYRCSLVLGRFLGIFISVRVSTRKMLTLASFFLCLILIVFILDGLVMKLDSLEFGLCAIYGLVLAPINGSLVNVTEQHVVPVRGKVFAILSVCSSIGIAINSPLIGHLMDTISPMCFLYVLFVETALLSFFCFCLISLIRVLEKSFQKNNDVNKNENYNKAVQKLAEGILLELQEVKNEQNGYQKFE